MSIEMMTLAGAEHSDSSELQRRARDVASIAGGVALHDITPEGIQIDINAPVDDFFTPNTETIMPVGTNTSPGETTDALSTSNSAQNQSELEATTIVELVRAMKKQTETMESMKRLGLTAARTAKLVEYGMQSGYGGIGSVNSFAGRP